MCGSCVWTVGCAQLLANHIIMGEIPLGDLKAQIEDAEASGLSLKTLGGSSLVFQTDGTDIFITPEGAPSGYEPAVLLFSDFENCAGLMHTVSKVLAPMSATIDKLGESDRGSR
jgi:uncharacterized surface protein with fasciclin (FAS1) repeats